MIIIMTVMMEICKLKKAIYLRAITINEPNRTKINFRIVIYLLSSFISVFLYKSV